MKLAKIGYDNWKIQMKVMIGSQSLWKFVKNGFVERELPFVETHLSTIQMTELKELGKGIIKLCFLYNKELTSQQLRRFSILIPPKKYRRFYKNFFKVQKNLRRYATKLWERNLENLKVQSSETISHYFNRALVITNQIKRMEKELMKLEWLRK